MPSMLRPEAWPLPFREKNAGDVSQNIMESANFLYKS